MGVALLAAAIRSWACKVNSTSDHLDDMGKDIALPEVTQHAIMNYSLPDHEPGEKYAPFTYFHTDSTGNLCVTVHNIASAEMLYSSSGEHFDKRARELRQSPNIIEGIILHANRKNENQREFVTPSRR